MAKVGETLSPMRLEAVVTERRLELPQHGANLLLIMFFSQQEAEQAKAMLMELRTTFQDLERFKMVNIIDATAVPRLMRGAAKGMVGSIYKRAAEQVPEPFDPADVLFFCIDWDGKLHQAFEIPTKHGLQMLMVDAQGHVIERGSPPAQDTLVQQVRNQLA